MRKEADDSEKGGDSGDGSPRKPSSENMVQDGVERDADGRPIMPDYSALPWYSRWAKQVCA